LPSEPTSGSIDKDTPSPKQKGHDLGNRTRNDIYDRFDNKFKDSDSSSDQEESNAGTDSKQDPDSGEHPEIVLDTPEKPTSVKKRKVKKEASQEEQKTVPLQALHESRERFKTLNLASREYKSQTDDKIKALELQLQNLTTKLTESRTEKDSLGDIDVSDVDPEKAALKKRLAELEGKFKSTDQEKAIQAQLEAQKVQQQKIQTVSKELTEEGYPGFDVALLKTGTKLQELVKSGEITESESADAEMWKKIYKEQIYSEVRTIFNEQAKEDTMEKKRQAKKKANLISSPGKAPEKQEETPTEDLSYSDFVKQGVKDRLQANKRKFYPHSK